MYNFSQQSYNFQNVLFFVAETLSQVFLGHPVHQYIKRAHTYFKDCGKNTYRGKVLTIIDEFAPTITYSSFN